MLKQTSLIFVTVWIQISTRGLRLTGSMTEVPGGPGTPSAPGRPALPGEPCRMERRSGKLAQ